MAVAPTPTPAMRPSSRTLPLLLALATLVASGPGAARALALQEDPAAWAPEELDSLEARAARAPLFRSHEPLELTLRTRIQHLLDERPDEEEVDGWAVWTTASGGRDSVDVEVRGRGNFRLQKRNCTFPPLRLDFPRSRVGGTPFGGQDKLKLVTPCNHRREDYQQYILQEYLAYRVYNLVTPVSYRVRLVEITYEDTEGRFETMTRVGFLIEDDEAMAHRNRGFVSEWGQFHPGAADADHLALLAFFQYMIGNTDWSQPFFHNVDMIRTWDEGRYLVVPYDFDWTGVVDAAYAEPDPMLGTESVRDRVYRGFCLEGADLPGVRRRYQELRDEVRALYEDAPFLDEEQRERTLDYYEEFWRDLDDFRRYRRRILEACIPLPP